MAFKMNGFPMQDTAFKHKGKCGKHKHPHWRNGKKIKTGGCTPKEKAGKVAGFVGKVGALIGIGKFAKNKLDNM